MNNLADLIDPLDGLDALLDAGADMAQALQDLVDEAVATGDGDECADLQRLVDTWERAYRQATPAADEEPE